jgi:photosystem II stability/assembly factor-like uncharacterized protein
MSIAEVKLMGSPKLNRLTDLLFYLALLLFIIGFSFTDNPVGNWYQQFMPNLNGRSVTDITFLDSLTGYAVTNNFSPSDTGYILKTTNGGDNWIINATLNRNFTRIQFINNDTGFVCGGTGGGTPYIYKTTNAGSNWFVLSTFGCSMWRDMFALNNDTIWAVDNVSLCGGVFRTTNGGVSWQNQGSFGSYNPEKIYMFNRNIGFITKDFGSSSHIYKTTDSGANWSIIVSNDYFTDMYFADSLTGWKCSVFGMKKTTDGGFNWVTQVLPYGGIIQSNGIGSFSNINRDTIWGNGGSVLYPNNRYGFILNKTTNGGANWLFQIPDTSFFRGASFVEFTDRLHGWAYGNIHTTTGGDTIFYTPVQQISISVPKNFILGQNYPNPFNTSSKFKVLITSNVKRQTSDVKVIVYDVRGKEITKLMDENLKPGEYEITFDAKELPSGIYFYSLIVEGNLIDTKKMVLLK